MAKKAESLNLPVTLDTTLNQEEKGTDEMSEGTYEMSEFIGQEKFEDNEKKVRYYYFSTALLFTSFTRNTERWRKREREEFKYNNF